MTDNLQEEKPIAYSVPGALCIFVSKTEDNSVEYFKNLDGFRICPETGDIHAIQFLVDRWEKIVLKGYQFRAARSIRGNPNQMSSHKIEYFYDTQNKKLCGLQISEFCFDGELVRLMYSCGNTSYKDTFIETVFYNAGIKSLQVVFQTVLTEIASMPEEQRDYDFWQHVLSGIKEVYEQ